MKTNLLEIMFRLGQAFLHSPFSPVLLTGENSSTPDSHFEFLNQPRRVGRRTHVLKRWLASQGGALRTASPYLQVRELLIAAILFLSLSFASAGTHVWSGAAGFNSAWSNPGNWSSGGVPTVGETAPVIIVFPTNGSTLTMMDIPNLTVHQMNNYRSNLTLSGSAGARLNLSRHGTNAVISNFAPVAQVQSSLELVLANACLVGAADYTRLTLATKLSGPGSLIVGGAGVVELSGSASNTFAGSLTVTNEAQVWANKSSGGAATGSVMVALSWHWIYNGWESVLVPERGTLVLQANNQLSTTAPITIQGTLLCSNSADQAFSSVLVHGGAINSYAGKLSLLGDLTVRAREDAPTNASFPNPFPFPLPNLGGGDPEFLIAGHIDLGSPGVAATRVWNIENHLQLDADVQGNTLVTLRKEGAGRLSLLRPSTYYGPTIVSNGSVRLHAPSALGSPVGGTTISPLATLIVTNGLTLLEPLIVDGGTNSPPKDQIDGWYPVSGWGISPGGSMTLNGPLQIFGNVGHRIHGSSAFTIINGAITGPGHLTLRGEGTVEFGGKTTNTFSGGLVVDDQIQLYLSKTNWATAVPCDVVMPPHVASVARVILEKPHQIADNVVLSICFPGELNMGTNDDIIGGLELLGGQVLGTGKLGVEGPISAFAHTNMARIMTPLSLGAAEREVYVEPAAGAIDLWIPSVISSLGFGGIRKTGDGILRLSNLNTYGGGTTVMEGVLSIADGQSLGGTYIGTSIYTNGVLEMPYSDAVLGESLSFFGGTLRLTGSNIWGGYVVLGAGGGTVEVNGANSSLLFTNLINGAGAFNKRGSGSLELGGTTANTFTGPLNVVNGSLRLRKSAGLNAVSGSALSVGDARSGGTSAVVDWLNANQVADNCAVTLHGTSDLRFNSFPETFGSLFGKGDVMLGASQLTLGGDNSSSSFNGLLYGAGAILVKNGTGLLTLNGSNTMTGNAVINGGQIAVNGTLPCWVVLNNGAMVSGNGLVGNVSGPNGIVSPGNSTGLLKSGTLTMSANHTFRAELNGTTAGASYDQLQVTGTVNLGGAALNVMLGFAGSVSNQFVIISNDGTDAVTGTFAGLAEGATFTASGAQFKITYKGGSSNDVVLTQVTVATPPKSTGITMLPNGQMQIGGDGIAGQLYNVQANANLSTTNWMLIGDTTADGSGKFSFIDTNAPNFPMRFYRFVIP